MMGYPEYTFNMKILILTFLLPLIGNARASIDTKHLRGPKFVHEPPEFVEFSNSSGTVVPCSAKGQPDPTIRWEKRDGSPVLGLSGVRQVRPDHSLVFFPISRERYRQDVHATVYRCLATNSVGTIRSRDVHVKAVIQQQYDVHVSDHFVIRGNTAVLQCHTPPSIRPYIKTMLWLRDDGISIGSPGIIGDKYSILPSGELLVHNVLTSDSVIGYQCQIHHKLIGESKLSLTAGKLIIREPHVSLPPTITESNPNIRGTESERIFLPCVAQGYPNPKYRWARKDGDRMTVLHLSDRIQQKDGILIFKKAAIQDTGIYVCIVNNSMGEDKAETKLLISAALSAMIQPERQTVDVGKAVNLNCHVTGHPVHSVVWFKDSRLLVATGPVNLVSRDYVQINPVRREDSGMYQCFASNHQEVVQGTTELFISEDAPVLTYAFPEQAVHPGTAISLKCSASGNPLPQITWQVDGYPVPEAYHVRVGDYVSDERTVNSYVNVSGVSVEDGGAYTCIASNGVNVVSHSERLDVYGPPFVKIMPNVTALDGHSVKLHCAASGYPISRIFWERDGRSLPHNHRQKTFPNGTLIIEELQRSRDGGLYYCAAENNMSRTARREVSLNIMAPPVVEPFNFPPDLSEGKRTSTACTVSSGDLPIRITWLKDGKSLPEELKASVISATEYSTLLSFPSVSQIHNGNYTCVASNPVASRNQSAAMLVRVPPKWRTEPNDRSVIMSQSIMFDCQANGYPDPVIRWKKSTDDAKNLFQVIISSENVQILENGSLVIKEVSEEDSGKYMCQATNDVGPGLSTVVHLKVHVAAHFEEKFQALKLKKGESLLLKCKAAGEKPLSVSWNRDRHSFNPAFEPRYSYEEHIHSDGVEATIKITSVNRKDSALFTCIAQNAYGRDDTNFQVVVQEPPDRPTSLRIVNKGSRTATVSWPTPYSGNNAITKYTVEYKILDDPWTLAKVAIAEPMDASFTLQGLTPSSSYQIRVRAENTIGTGDFSDLIIVATESEAPSGPPKGVRAIATSSRTIQVTWKPPAKDEAHSLIDGYYVGYKSQSTEQFSYKTMESNHAGKLECEITNLNKFTKYHVIVQAFNSKGAGPPSEETTAHTLEFDPPASPELTIASATASSIHLRWTLEQKANPISGFIIFQKSESLEWEEVQLSEERSSYVFHGLQCGMRYQFYLVAFNNAGRGQPSDVIGAKTEGTVPIAPDRKALITINSTSVSIHLTSWQSGGCAINFFVVQYKALNQAEWILLSNNILPEQRSVTISDLTPASHYALLMTAHNDAGTTEAEYLFSTLTTTGGTVPPLTPTSDSDKELFQQLKIIIPIACTTIVLVLIITVACVVLIKKRNIVPEETSQEREVSKPVDTVPLNVWEKAGREDPRLSQSGEQLYFPSPYATSRISMYSGDGDPEHHQHHQQQQQQQHHHTWRNGEREHTYDVPFLPRQTVVPCLTVDRTSDANEGGEYRTGTHIYLNPAVVELPPDTAIRVQDLAYISSIAEAKVKSYLYAKPMKSVHHSGRTKERHTGRRARTTVVRRSDLENSTDGVNYYASDLETSPTNGESFEFSEAECDMHLRLAIEERPV